MTSYPESCPSLAALVWARRSVNVESLGTYSSRLGRRRRGAGATEDGGAVILDRAGRIVTEPVRLVLILFLSKATLLGTEVPRFGCVGAKLSVRAQRVVFFSSRLVHFYILSVHTHAFNGNLVLSSWCQFRSLAPRWISSSIAWSFFDCSIRCPSDFCCKYAAAFIRRDITEVFATQTISFAQPPAHATARWTMDDLG